MECVREAGAEEEILPRAPDKNETGHRKLGGP